MKSQQDSICPLCGQRGARIHELGTLNEVYRIECSHCQLFQITDEAYEEVRRLPVERRTVLAAYNCHLRLKDPKTTLTYYSSAPKEPNESARVITEVIQSWWPAKHVWNRLDVVLLNIYNRAGTKPGSEVIIPFEDYPFSFGEDGPAGYYILNRLYESGLILMNPKEGGPRRVQLTLSGFHKVDEIQRGVNGRESRKVFVAMSFDPAMDTLYDRAIEPAIEACGYDAFRIDRTEHNEKICDMIEASIRQSRFMVSDFTQNKHGVYYEAGLARGLGLQVIWCVKKSDIGSLHFDTRQYNHIDWEDETDLRKRLEDRIRAMGL